MSTKWEWKWKVPLAHYKSLRDGQSARLSRPSSYPSGRAEILVIFRLARLLVSRSLRINSSKRGCQLFENNLKLLSKSTFTLIYMLMLNCLYNGLTFCGCSPQTWVGLPTRCHELNPFCWREISILGNLRTIMLVFNSSINIFTA